MPLINFPRRTITCKLVYYGPGLSGKTTNLEIVHKRAPEDRKGDLTTIATEGDRTLFFDYMPLELGKVGGLKTSFQLYTVPGQAYYNATRKLVLRGADGVVFVADSQEDMLEQNLESFENLIANLEEEGVRISQVPMVIQWNKRDMPRVLPIPELDAAINRFNVPTVEAVAVTGEGVFPTLKKLAELVLIKLNEDFGLKDVEGTGRRQRAPARAKNPEPPPPVEPPPEPAPTPVATPLPLPPPRLPAARTPQPVVGVRGDGDSGTEPSPGRARQWVRHGLRALSIFLLGAAVALAYGAWAGHLPWLASLLEGVFPPR